MATLITDNDHCPQDTIKHHAPLALSDHCVLTWKYLVSVEDKGNDHDDNHTELTKKKWNVNKGDYTKLNDILDDIDWQQQFHDKDLEECVEVFYEITNQKIADCIPPQKNSSKKKRYVPPWMTKSARKEIRKKTCAWNRYMQSNTYKRYQEYVKVRNKTAKKTRKAKWMYEKKLASECKTNPKAFL